MERTYSQNEQPDMKEYFSGKKLYGDDFTLSQIQQWFEDEKEAYASLPSSEDEKQGYSYHEINKSHAFNYLPNRKFNHVLGFGSAHGEELIPIIKKAGKITILEPSDAFEAKVLHGVPVEYKKPSMDGKLPFENSSIDLITCFGVLHHIPNVKYVIEEMYRILSSGGYLVLREPTISMGDWRIARKGLTKRERGIPLNIIKSIIEEYGFNIVHAKRCIFPLTRLIINKPFSSTRGIIVDGILSTIFSFNNIYHATNSLQKLRPTSIYYVLKK